MSDLALFRAFVKVGQRLAETSRALCAATRIPAHKREKAGEKLDYRVTKMRLSKDKTSLTYNRFLTLSAIPPQDLRIPFLSGHPPIKSLPNAAGPPVSLPLLEKQGVTDS